MLLSLIGVRRGGLGLQLRGVRLERQPVAGTLGLVGELQTRGQLLADLSAPCAVLGLAS